MRIVAVPVNHQMDVHVPEARQHCHAFGGNYFGAGWNSERANLSDGFDSFTFDNDDAIANWLAAKAVQQGSSHKRFQGS